MQALGIALYQIESNKYVNVPLISTGKLQIFFIAIHKILRVEKKVNFLFFFCKM